MHCYIDPKFTSYIRVEKDTGLGIARERERQREREGERRSGVSYILKAYKIANYDPIKSMFPKFF